MTTENNENTNDTTNSTALAIRAPSTLALEPSNFVEAIKVATIVHKTGICNVKSPEDALVRIMAGREIGLGTMSSLRLVYVVNNRPAFDASLVRARVMQHPEFEIFEPVGEMTETSVTYRAKRKGQNEQKKTWTIDMAKRAGLATKDSWKNYPISMLSARATMDLARIVFPESVIGMYVPDEVETRTVTNPATNEIIAEVITDTTDGTTINGTPEQEAIEALITEIAMVSSNRTVENFKELKQALREKIGNLKSSLPESAFDSLKNAYTEAFTTNGAGSRTTKETTAS